MTTDASELLVPHARLFTVGFVRTDPPAPSVLGSGVLLTVGKISGILTCAHVAEAYRDRSEIGLLRFSRDNILQKHKLNLGDTHTVYVEENIGDPPWSNPYAFDLAFTRLPPDVVATLNATCVFLNWERNMQKLWAGEPKYDRHVDAAFGLVHEFSGEPVRGAGEVTTQMQGILTPGHVVARENGVMTLECMKENIPQLPKSFGARAAAGYGECISRMKPTVRIEPWTLGSRASLRISGMPRISCAKRWNALIRVLCRLSGRTWADKKQ